MLGNQDLVILTPGLNGPYQMFETEHWWPLTLVVIMTSASIVTLLFQILIVGYLFTKPPPKRPIEYLLLYEQV